MTLVMILMVERLILVETKTTLVSIYMENSGHMTCYYSQNNVATDGKSVKNRIEE